ncbi:outer membrane protein assembly factor BamD [Hirschia baltica]|uniref:Outer membrane protein assembly factor BamD n=1 Tax=Hirschia baltica (strain ATCC 49814 / DSM 5838 / IFAM 1418) TaxID=582402 RepID=C6XMG7_HIRBI|nr:outer membrane protein assembly factor BamD [Hirschia baltica]ACT58110.1 outer membrane assembly lipoprotein YfiO [Hirschia baltica ATCC 49814]
MANKRNTFLLVTISASALIMTSCSSSDRKKDLAYIEKPVEQLYNEAGRSVDRKQWDRAALEFQEVQRQHPYSEWAERAMLMTAYVQYKSRQYAEVEASAGQYTALYPSSKSAAYAYYLIALSHFDQITDVGRDQGRTELALSALQDVVRRYPTTEYARDAELKIDMVRDQLAGKEMEVGRYYLKSSEFLAAINRFKRVVDEYETTTHAPEALHRLVEAYLSIGLVGQAQAAAAVLGHNYPSSRWYRDSYKLMEKYGSKQS